MKEIKKRQFLAMNFCVHKITPRIGRKKCVNNNSMIVTREPQNYTPVIFPLLMRIYFFFFKKIQIKMKTTPASDHKRAHRINV